MQSTDIVRIHTHNASVCSAAALSLSVSCFDEEKKGTFTDSAYTKNNAWYIPHITHSNDTTSSNRFYRTTINEWSEYFSSSPFLVHILHRIVYRVTSFDTTLYYRRQKNPIPISPILSNNLILSVV